MMRGRENVEGEGEPQECEELRPDHETRHHDYRGDGGSHGCCPANAAAAERAS
jgi:hypothetical protein